MTVQARGQGLEPQGLVRTTTSYLETWCGKNTEALELDNWFLSGNPTSATTELWKVMTLASVSSL